MAHVEYRQWYTLIKKVIARYRPVPAPRLFEVGGGTGVLGRMLAADGCRYLGSDLSAAMCGLARARDLPFICADARRPPVTGPFDLIIFLYDGINYFGEDDYERFFTEMHPLLDTGGLLLFDITTQYNSRMHFVDFLDYDEYDDAFYLRHSFYDARTGIQHNRFTIFLRESDGKGYCKHHEHHHQLVLPVAAIKKRIPADLFSIVGIWDGYSFSRHTARSDRIHFCLKKKG
jgi:cyclopropane fatty-acyl-phospholipid synthase-like methyltransferase